MQADAAASATRNQALSLCRAHGFAAFHGVIREDVPAAAVAGLLIDLEAAFGIDLDADELWREVRAIDLAALVEAKVGDRARRALLPANDDAPGQPAPFLDRRRQRLVPHPPAAHAVRAKRIRERLWHAQRLRDTYLRLALIAFAAGAFGGLAFGVAALFGAA